MLLCIDIGNTNIKLGLFSGNTMKKHWRIASDQSKLADEYAVLMSQLFEVNELIFSEVRGVAISSVVPPLTLTFIELCQRYMNLEPVMYKNDHDLGIKINTDYPAEVGSDLIMNAIAAYELFKAELIVVGFGTATSFTAVSKMGDIEGVAIAPGILTSSDSLFRSASALPQVALSHPQAAIGKNTMDSMRAGIVFGFVGLVEALIKRMKVELGGEPRVIATGGLAPLIAPETDMIELVEPNLALLGLKRMYDIQLNKKR